MQPETKNRCNFFFVSCPSATSQLVVHGVQNRRITCIGLRVGRYVAEVCWSHSAECLISDLKKGIILPPFVKQAFFNQRRATTEAFLRRIKGGIPSCYQNPVF